MPGRGRPATRRRRRRRHPHRSRTRAHGAVRLTQLHRFTDPDEAAATLQVRDGDPAAVDFYTDRDRIKIGDPAGLPDRLLAAWRHDQDARPGLADAGPVPPRRSPTSTGAPELPGSPGTQPVPRGRPGRRQPGQRRRPDHHPPQRPPTGQPARGWVRNGDRWTVTGLTADGAIHATHRRTGKPVTLPGSYVREAVELGYATTIHAAQGVTADTTHGLVDELMTREQLYTMVSRGRTANHLYVAVGDGDPHRILQTDTQEPTATDILQRVLSRTSLPVSATTVRAQHARAAAVAASGRVRTRPVSPAHDYNHWVPAGRGPQPTRPLSRLAPSHRSRGSASPPLDHLVFAAEVKGAFGVAGAIRCAHPGHPRRRPRSAGHRGGRQSGRTSSDLLRGVRTPFGSGELLVAVSPHQNVPPTPSLVFDRVSHHASFWLT